MNLNEKSLESRNPIQIEQRHRIEWSEFSNLDEIEVEGKMEIFFHNFFECLQK